MGATKMSDSEEDHEDQDGSEEDFEDEGDHEGEDYDEDEDEDDEDESEEEEATEDTNFIEDIRAHVLEFYGFYPEKERKKRDEKVSQFKNYIEDSGINMCFY